MANRSRTGSEVAVFSAGAAAAAAAEAGAVPPRPEKRAAISMGTTLKSLPLCSVARSTPRMVPAWGG